MEKTEKFTLNLNGESKTVKIDPSTPMLWVLRDELKLTDENIVFVYEKIVLLYKIIICLYTNIAFYINI